jgi:hypothetical protein
MAKRFIDTNLFDDEWYMDLSKDAKIFWIYCITKCDHAGILELNEKLCKFQTGIKSLETVFKELGNRLITLRQPYIFIPKFLFFQYPNFPNSNVKAQQSAIKELINFEVLDKDTLTLKEGLGNYYGYGNGNGNGNEYEKEEKTKNYQNPTLQEVKQYFKDWGYSEKAAEKAFNYYEAANWHDSKGNKVKNWKQKMQSVWFKDENIISNESKRSFNERTDLPL